MKASFVKSVKEAEGIYSFLFRPEKKLRFIAGQYIDLGLPGRKFEGEYSSRWFTISNPPYEELVQITTKFYKKHSQFKEALFGLKKDDEVSISAPLGDFVLPKNSSIPIVFIAGGIGATPYRSILLDLTNKKEQRDITLIYGANSEDEAIFEDVFSKLGNNFHKIIGSHLDADLIMKSTADPKNSYFYISGPEPMVYGLKDQLETATVPANHLFIDAFDGYKTID